MDPELAAYLGILAATKLTSGATQAGLFREALEMTIRRPELPIRAEEERRRARGLPVERCALCDSWRPEAGSPEWTCGNCGTRSVVVPEVTPAGDCPACGGTGTVRKYAGPYGGASEVRCPCLDRCRHG
jgi:hypothetical protein